MYICPCYYKPWFIPKDHLGSLQDTVEELGAMGTSAVDDFDWLVQLRSYIEADGSGKGRNLWKSCTCLQFRGTSCVWKNLNDWISLNQSLLLRKCEPFAFNIIHVKATDLVLSCLVFFHPYGAMSIPTSHVTRLKWLPPGFLAGKSRETTTAGLVPPWVVLVFGAVSGLIMFDWRVPSYNNFLMAVVTCCYLKLHTYIYIYIHTYMYIDTYRSDIDESWYIIDIHSIAWIHLESTSDENHVVTFMAIGDSGMVTFTRPQLSD